MYLSTPCSRPPHPRAGSALTAIVAVAVLVCTTAVPLRGLSQVGMIGMANPFLYVGESSSGRDPVAAAISDARPIQPGAAIVYVPVIPASG